MLYIMTERWPAASRYRNTFDCVKESVFDKLLCSSQKPCTPITTFAIETQDVLNSLNQEFHGSSTTDLNDIIDIISGKAMGNQEFDATDWDFTMDNIEATISPNYFGIEE